MITQPFRHTHTRRGPAQSSAYAKKLRAHAEGRLYDWLEFSRMAERGMNLRLEEIYSAKTCADVKETIGTLSRVNFMTKLLAKIGAIVSIDNWTRTNHIRDQLSIPLSIIEQAMFRSGEAGVTAFDVSQIVEVKICFFFFFFFFFIFVFYFAQTLCAYMQDTIGIVK